MRIGLIARMEPDRGLSIQSRNFFEHMPVAAVLAVEVPRDLRQDPAQYGPNVRVVRYDDRDHTLDEAVVRSWLNEHALDVVFTAETPYDWRFPAWCKDFGTKLVIQGNPEFYRHDSDASLAQPDAWWWPSPWRLNKVPPGPVMPCPMPEREPSMNSGGPARIVHVVGKRAYMDRNGTDIFARALRSVQGSCIVTIYGLDGQLPDIHPGRQMEVRQITHSVDDRWEMYRDQDLFVLPRSYGGNCLPALEAAASGVAVMMPEIEPNSMYATHLVPIRRRRPYSLPCGPVMAGEVNYRDLAEAIDRAIAPDERGLRSGLLREKQNARELVPRWSVWRELYLEELAKVVAS